MYTALNVTTKSVELSSQFVCLLLIGSYFCFLAGWLVQCSAISWPSSPLPSRHSGCGGPEHSGHVWALVPALLTEPALWGPQGPHRSVQRTHHLSLCLTGMIQCRTTKMIYTASDFSPGSQSHHNLFFFFSFCLEQEFSNWGPGTHRVE